MVVVRKGVRKGVEGGYVCKVLDRAQNRSSMDHFR